MALSDQVAKFIYNAMRLTTVMSGNTTMREQQQAISRYVSSPYPQQSLTVMSTLTVGDVLEPSTVGCYVDTDHAEQMSYMDKLLVYSISCPEGEFNLPSDIERGTNSLPTASIVLVRYESDTIDFDLSKIVSVLCVGHHHGLCGLLTGFRLLGNIKERMV